MKIYSVTTIHVAQRKYVRIGGRTGGGGGGDTSSGTLVGDGFRME